ncbi:D-alanine-D-alanine ligase [Methylacidimicrobium cyclopophantes]|uniref:D-alanine--D-alanine ligase n=1 Tax=Methylacidimicrobium cyclopophantes TaxID=1041766 RepID=A0A5E6M8P2_9BACT|nr:D-alanine--D-alanine ligase [Methylacidimicrobium cyclopophantes]VVM05754.1 D-alanine-D-alanine ligase [Methylacidimicrobium cyclopophantes]
MKEKLRVVVLEGGPSHEREVSLRTGRAVTAALRQLDYPVEEIDLRDVDLSLPQDTDIVFLCLHGTFGEDGQVQRLLLRRGVRFTGSGAEASERAFDKSWSKEIFRKSGVPTPDWALARSGDKLPLPLPFVIKPARQGSSIGISLVFQKGEYREAYIRAAEEDHLVIAEAYIQGRELTVGILGSELLPVVEIRPKAGFYDYRNKYTPGAVEYLCPAPLTGEEADSAARAALAAYRALGCTVYGRVDLLLDADGKPWVIEVNTIPGMTETSLFPKAARAAGLEFPQLCEKILLLSWEERNAR